MKKKKKAVNHLNSEFPKRINSVRKKGLSAQWLGALVLELDMPEVETLLLPLVKKKKKNVDE